MPSPTVPTANQSESDVLDVRADIWQKRPLLRQIYHRYFAEMVRHLAANPSPIPNLKSQISYGTLLEIGGGSGNFKQYFRTHHAGQGTLIASDIVPTVHCDLAADAMALPFPDNSLDNILMMDVLHHIPFPLKFFAEAQRTLRRGGRIVMTEPCITPASRLVFAIAHPEPVDMSAQVFSDDPHTPDPTPLRNPKTKSAALRTKNPNPGAFASNQATPNLLFYRDLEKFRLRFPDLKVILRRRRSLLVYPLSGGFSGPQLLPASLAPLFWPLENLFSPLAGLLAFRLLIVLEKR